MFPDGDIIIQILMPFSHQRQITLKDILRYEDMQIKYEWLPWIAFSNSEIFKVVFWSAMALIHCAQTDTWE